MLNFDWTTIRWAFDWADPKYDHWGSPTCPVEPHDHRPHESMWLGQRGPNDHSVDYPKDSLRMGVYKSQDRV